MISKNKIQIEIESILSTKLLKSISDLKNTDVINYKFSNAEKEHLKNIRVEDVKGLMYKGLISILIAIEKFREKNYSWPTINLYYSCFYLLKASLCARNVLLFRKERDMYQIDIDESDNLTKIPSAHKSDHNSSIFLFQKKYAATDILQSNIINEQNSYEWLRTKREEINYKYPTFTEPDCPDFWSEIKNNYPTKQFTKLLRMYQSDSDLIYPFLEDHAILALPLKRLELTIKDVTDNDITKIFSEKQNKVIKEKINRLKLTVVFNPMLEKCS